MKSDRRLMVEFGDGSSDEYRIRNRRTTGRPEVRDTRAKHHGASNWLMLDLIERKIGLDAQRLYEERGHAEGRELENWLNAASEVLATLNAS